MFFLGISIAFVFGCNHQNKINSDSSDKNKEFSTNALKKIKDTFVDSLYSSNLNYYAEPLDNTKGLSNSSVNTIFQDSQNLLWIGTWDGLNRYDGSSFKIFRPDFNNENSLNNQVILKVTEDESGLIWILTMSGINSYHKKRNSFQRYSFSNKNEFTISEGEFNFAIDNSKKLFCAVKNWGLGYYDGQKFQKVGVQNLPLSTVKKMKFTESGNLMMLFGNNELFSLEIQAKNNNKKFISKAKMISDSIESFGFLPNHKICLINSKGKATIQSLVNNKQQKIDRNGIKKFIGNTRDAAILSDKGGYFSINELGNINSEPWFDHINNQVLSTLIQGTEGIIWTGSDGDGLLKMYPYRKSFNLVSTVQIPELDEGIVRAFLEVKDNSFFVGTKGKGLFQIPSKFYLNTDKTLLYNNYNESNSSINNSVYALCKGQSDLVFIGTDGNGISIFDLKNSKMTSWSEIIDNELYDEFKSIYAIYQDNDGFIWVGTNGYGLIRFKISRERENLKVSQFKSYQASDEEDGLLSSNIIFSIVPKNDEKLWIGTRLGGLNLFNKKSGSAKVYKHIRNDSQSLSSNDILSLHMDSNKNLWIGTSFGLNLLESSNENLPNFRSFTVKDGLPNNTIHGIASDNNSNLWISTNFGLSNFIIADNRFINFTKKEGLQNNEYSDGAYYQSPLSDFVFMGGIKGFNYFLPSKSKESILFPDVLIDKISGQNQKIPYYQGLLISPNSKSHPSITLDHNQNFFDVELATLTFINNEKCQFEYQLENFDQNWNQIKNNRNISFTNVPPGNYSLWLKWSNSDGIWTNPVKAIEIKINPVFWQSNMAYGFYLILLILLITLVISYFKKRLSLRQNIIFRKKEEELHQKRLNFFTNIAHELQTPLTLVVGPAQKLSETISLSEKNRKFLRMIQRNSSRLLFLTQQLLDFRKAEYDYLEVSVKNFDLVDLLEQIVELFDEWALEKKINYHLKHPSHLIGWYDKDKIEKIVFNLLSNAFKYTPDNGNIDIEFIQNHSNLIITISNTGKGISKEKLDHLFERFFISNDGDEISTELFRTGIGLAYVKKLVTVLKGSITVANGSNDLTSFEVQLPFNKENFNQKELDKNMSQVLISQHLKNILEDGESQEGLISDKISILNNVENDRKVILIVEDEKEIHMLLNELLKDQYKILKAFNGIEALEIMKNNIPDLIISDVMMPEMDGIELCDKIKNEINTCHIPFIILSAKNSILDRIEGLERGANSYIPKPFHPDHLLIRIQKLLEEKDLILKHFTKNDLESNYYNLPVSEGDKEFVKTVIKLIRQNLDDEKLNSLFLEKTLGMSNSQLYRKIKQIFGFSTGDLIRTIRLKHAAELLKKSSLTVSEICFQSGFNNRSYFYREFKKTYHTTPKDFQLKNN